MEIDYAHSMSTFFMQYLGAPSILCFACILVGSIVSLRFAHFGDTMEWRWDACWDSHTDQKQCIQNGGELDARVVSSHSVKTIANPPEIGLKSTFLWPVGRLYTNKVVFSRFSPLQWRTTPLTKSGQLSKLKTASPCTLFWVPFLFRCFEAFWNVSVMVHHRRNGN